MRELSAEAQNGFTDSMDDDFNTAGAIGSVFDVVRAVNVHLTEHTEPDIDGLQKAKEFLDEANIVMGFFAQESATSDSSEIDAHTPTKRSKKKQKI